MPERRTCVAHALVMTCLAKNTCPASCAVGRFSVSFFHLNRNTRPYTGLHTEYAVRRRNSSCGTQDACKVRLAHTLVGQAAGGKARAGGGRQLGAARQPVLVGPRLHMHAPHLLQSIQAKANSAEQSNM